MPEKKCRRCGNVQNLDCFPKQRQAKDGRHSYCKMCNYLRAQKWREAHPNKAKKSAESYRVRNQEKARLRAKQWRDANRERDRANARNWAKNNPDRKRQYEYEYQQKRLEQDATFRTMRRLRDRLKKAIKNKAKTGSAVKDLGMPVDALLVYLNLDALDKYGIPYTGNEHLFHIDHIRPLASFNLEDLEQLRIAVRWDNLQVLSVAENLRKGAKLIQ